MYWFIAAAIIASGIMLFAPRSVPATNTAKTESTSATVSGSQYCLLILAVLVSLWLLFTQSSADKLLPVVLTLGLTGTCATLLIARLQSLLLPSALITTILLVLNFLNML
ncbi:hypothetical protein [Shewanella litorisediminis]|uniref:Uncharacterized protein n=1 Tax=Shewanella litorisediminis TaxID=1173586 RepID=A0ABX7G0L2_9GAMM|nr:hypothetical protein [Shewanella litorisediminis]MCL2918190.1 hypothetical protein [Shewanella litorisediminis]QRH00757.1 hypothetical protein JQC75_12815 [Shewanella litorisediminis]